MADPGFNEFNESNWYFTGNSLKHYTSTLPTHFRSVLGVTVKIRRHHVLFIVQELQSPPPPPKKNPTLCWKVICLHRLEWLMLAVHFSYFTLLSLKVLTGVWLVTDSCYSSIKKLPSTQVVLLPSKSYPLLFSLNSLGNVGKVSGVHFFKSYFHKDFSYKIILPEESTYFLKFWGFINYFCLYSCC